MSSGAMQDILPVAGMAAGGALGGPTGAMIGGSIGSSLGGGKGGSPSMPTTLPTLGGGRGIPMRPSGAFMPLNTGGGYFNSIANRGAGPLFNPSIQNHALSQASPMGAKGADPYMKHMPPNLNRSRF